MRFVRVREGDSVVPGVIVDDQIVDLDAITADIDGAFLGRDDLHEVVGAAIDGANRRQFAGADLAAPIARPIKICCIGLNFSDHAAESGLEIPAEPVLFMKDPSTIVGPDDDVLIPRNSVKTDWEIELGVVIGREARYLASPEDAAAVIGGYVLSHDVSEREFQLERGGQWDKGKSCETFNPLGPWVATPDEIGDPQALGMRLWVNGVLRQNGTSANQIFSVHHVVWYLSQFLVLKPGDLINTGTPAGVGLGIPGQPYLRAGDVVELSIDGLGSARQTFRDA
jgi:2-keto-4-pentenoate hydratase/2-oxohepta-3-ene-1,7-dioic acid hydratase in catechol pathway